VLLQYIQYKRYLGIYSAHNIKKQVFLDGAKIVYPSHNLRRADVFLGFFLFFVFFVRFLSPLAYLSYLCSLPVYFIQAFCVNLPAWSSLDQVICLSEMKLGFMASGCLAPGCSTLLANLFVMRSYKRVTLIFTP
jgi:Calcium-activated BK potassium channel alpha subunit